MISMEKKESRGSKLDKILMLKALEGLIIKIYSIDSSSKEEEEVAAASSSISNSEGVDSNKADFSREDNNSNNNQLKIYLRIQMLSNWIWTRFSNSTEEKKFGCYYFTNLLRRLAKS